MSWVLIVFVASYTSSGGIALTSHEFGDKEACVSAAEHLESRIAQQSNRVLMIHCYPMKTS